MGGWVVQRITLGSLQHRKPHASARNQATIPVIQPIIHYFYYDILSSSNIIESTFLNTQANCVWKRTKTINFKNVYLLLNRGSSSRLYWHKPADSI